MGERVKVIFLDIDGVLNHRPRMFGLDDKCVAILKRILDSTGAKIVVSSSWRYFPDEPNVKGSWRDTLASMLGRDTQLFIGDTPDICIIDTESGKFIRRRGEEIKSWLDENSKMELTYCVLDDEISDIVGMVNKRSIFKTNNRIGLTNVLANRMIEFLNNGWKKRNNRKGNTKDGIR